MGDELQPAGTTATPAAPTGSSGGGAPPGGGEDAGVQWLKDNAHRYPDSGLPSAGGEDRGGARGETTEAGSGDAGSGDAGSGGAQKETPESPLYKRALQALRRGLPKAMRGQIDDMSREEVLERGLELHELQSEQDRIAEEHGKLSKAGKPDGAANEEADPGRQDATTPGNPADTSSKLDLTKQLSSLDADLHGEELPEALKGVADEVVRYTDSRVQAAIKATKETLRGEVRGELDGIIDHVLGRQLEERFPMLREAEHRAEMQEAMERVKPPKGLSRIEGRFQQMQEACQIAFGSRIASREISSPSREQSNLDAPRQRVASEDTRDADERSRDWLRTYEETGGNLAAANRAGGFA